MTPALVVALLFALAGAVCFALVFAGLPGGWMLLGLAAVLELADPLWSGAGAATFGWHWIGAGVVAGLLGEALEFGSGVLGARVGGARRRGMVGAVAGGFLGALLLTFAAPVPVVGTLLGVFLGTFAGAFVAEMVGREGRSARASLAPALAATAARAAGLAIKAGLTLGIWLGLTSAALWGAGGAGTRRTPGMAGRPNTGAGAPRIAGPGRREG